MSRIPSLIVVAIAVVWSAMSVCAQDPAVVNSTSIGVKFENERVRVLEATLPPGLKEQVHSHPAYVIYVVEGGRFRNYAADGKITEGWVSWDTLSLFEQLMDLGDGSGSGFLSLLERFQASK